MILNFRKRERAIEAKEKVITKERQKFHKDANKTIHKLEEINKVLGNGITLEIGKATHR